MIKFPLSVTIGPAVGGRNIICLAQNADEYTPFFTAILSVAVGDPTIWCKF
jgi:hypothetical protein